MRQISCMSVFNVLFFNLSFVISIFAVVQLLLVQLQIAIKNFLKIMIIKSFLIPRSKSIDALCYKLTILLVTLFTNRLTFCSKK